MWPIVFIIAIVIVSILYFRAVKVWNSIPYQGLPETMALYISMQKMSIEELSQYGEMSLEAMCDADISGVHSFELWNSTSIGHLAYIAENHPSQSVRNEAESAIYDWKEWMVGKRFTR